MTTNEGKGDFKKERRAPKCKVAGCESRETITCRPFMCVRHVLEHEMFAAGWRSKTGHNWWAPDGQNLGPDGKVWDDFAEIMAAFLQYKEKVYEGHLAHQKWLEEREAKKAEPAAV